MCLFCLSDMDWRTAFLAKHEEEHPDHRFFRSVYPPFWVTASVGVYHGNNSCPCVDMNPSALSLHCGRCRAGRFPPDASIKVYSYQSLAMSIWSRNYHCATCRIEHGPAGSQYLCQACYSAENPTHLNQHEFVGWDVLIDGLEPVNDLVESRKQLWVCPQCPGYSKHECLPRNVLNRVKF